MKKHAKKRQLRKIRKWIAVAVLLVLILIFAPKLVRRGMELLHPRPYQALVRREAREFGLEEDLVYAVIKCESGFDPEAISRADAHGLMQLTQHTFEWVSSIYPPEKGGGDVLDVENNVHCGCALLRILLDEYGTRREALAAYNAGMGNVSNWLADERYSADGRTLHTIPFPETEAYVDRVEETLEMYRRLAA